MPDLFQRLKGLKKSDLPSDTGSFSCFSDVPDEGPFLLSPKSYPLAAHEQRWNVAIKKNSTQRRSPTPGLRNSTKQLQFDASMKNQDSGPAWESFSSVAQSLSRKSYPSGKWLSSKSSTCKLTGLSSKSSTLKSMGRWIPIDSNRCIEEDDALEHSTLSRATSCSSSSTTKSYYKGDKPPCNNTNFLRSVSCPTSKVEHRDTFAPTLTLDYTTGEESHVQESPPILLSEDIMTTERSMPLLRRSEFVYTQPLFSMHSDTTTTDYLTLDTTTTTTVGSNSSITTTQSLKPISLHVKRHQQQQQGGGRRRHRHYSKGVSERLSNTIDKRNDRGKLQTTINNNIKNKKNNRKMPLPSIVKSDYRSSDYPKMKEKRMTSNSRLGVKREKSTKTNINSSSTGRIDDKREGKKIQQRRVIESDGGLTWLNTSSSTNNICNWTYNFSERMRSFFAASILVSQEVYDVSSTPSLSISSSCDRREPSDMVQSQKKSGHNYKKKGNHDIQTRSGASSCVLTEYTESDPRPCDDCCGVGDLFLWC